MGLTKEAGGSSLKSSKTYKLHPSKSTVANTKAMVMSLLHNLVHKMSRVIHN